MNNEIKSENIVDLYVTPIMPIVLGKNFSPAEKFDAIRQSMESYATSRISELEGKVEFYRRETSKLRDYLEEHKIGKPSQKLFDALYEHIAELEAENEKNIKWANDAETRAVAADERIAELEAENKRLREKAEKWDALAAKMEKFYAEDSDADLVVIGEAAAAAFGYL